MGMWVPLYGSRFVGASVSFPATWPVPTALTEVALRTSRPSGGAAGRSSGNRWFYGSWDETPRAEPDSPRPRGSRQVG